MKAILCAHLLSLIVFLSCTKPTVDEPVTPNADSIRCAQTWQQFQLPKDTILQLHYQQPVEIVNGKDKMTLTVTQIDDFCTEESEKYTYGCIGRVWIQLKLNDQCVYQTKYGLTIGRRNTNPNFDKFGNSTCSKGNSANLIDDPLAFWALEFYNTFVLLNRLIPFAKNEQEFISLTQNPQNYTITLWLKKRCL